ncbi:LysE family translocator [Vibrio sp. WXL103]|uniref:LysE family translocator n=1 Tax=Vibrio sp. WXL103 TaxID=3450710 RepID=UPI003EC91249
MEYLTAVILFAISSSVTPGPNNIMVMTSGVNFGVKRTMPLLTGICIGFTIMLLVLGAGFSAVFELYPELHFVIKCFGVLYLLYLAYLIATSSGAIQSDRQSKPLTFMNGALFQWVNGKAWVVAMGAIAAFTTAGGDLLMQNMMIAATFLVVSFPCVAIWLGFGSLLKNVLNTPRRRWLFNLCMASLLVLSIVPVISEIIEQVLA